MSKHDLSAYSGGPDAITKHLDESLLADMEAARAEPLLPELEEYVEDGTWGPMLRHPLVYSVPLVLPGWANKAYLHKKEALAEALAEEEWHTAVFLHERAYRLRALIDITGRDQYEEPTPLVSVPEHWDLAADVWVDSENIEQCIEEWRALICQPGEYPTGLWLGDTNERAAFDALPDPIPAWRGGAVGDWSWTTNEDTAKFFTVRSKYEPRFALIPKADCFGYLTRRGEYELLVRLTDERYPLVYPNHDMNGGA